MEDPNTSTFIKPRVYGPPPFIQRLGQTHSVRTPLGHYRTESLFLEQWNPIESARPVYTLQWEDREDPRVPGSTLYSFPKRYVEYLDPTGYKAGIDLLGSWEHWQKLAKAKWFVPYVTDWNQQIVSALRAKGLETFVRQADKGDLKAAEWLTQFTVEGPPQKHTRGRPSKGDIRRAANDQAEAERAAKEDAARLGLGATNDRPA